MKQSKISERDKKLLIILVTILLVAASGFFVIKPNFDKAKAVKKDNVALQTELDTLKAKEQKKEEIRQKKEEKEAEITEIASKYPCLVKTEKIIEMMVKLEEKTNITLTSITLEGLKPFYVGTSVQTELEQCITDREVYALFQQEVEEVDVLQLIAAQQKFTISFDGANYKAFNNIIEYFIKNEYHMTIDSMDMAFDSSSGLLSGSITVSAYCMGKNGIPYIEPDLAYIQTKKPDIFDTFSKSK
ncbi:hypothetical protein [Anaeromicropila populeti]|uniref:Type IV pilus assembly protein PilO n=1 Tax=Anaeromicropila populeti TaxID=37658 RepID=A0A1I6INZ5_9FIRM|nr:hypothetical protein [Anaeromicropila populeti]SFR68446.1 hypothetical protein SAMN05661086_00967 [Anaeromicropila populeti]